MITLKDARKKGKLKQFVAERENQPPGDMDALDAALRSAVRTSREAPETSPPGSSGGCSGS